MISKSTIYRVTNYIKFSPQLSYSLKYRILIFFLPFFQAQKKVLKKVVRAKTKKIVFTIDCTSPVDDKVLDIASFEKYLNDRIKIDGKTGALAANGVGISRERTKIVLSSPSDVNFKKRQLKYLSKRYLKKQQLRDYLRVVASSTGSYEMRYFSISGTENDEDDEE